MTSPSVEQLVRTADLKELKSSQAMQNLGVGLFGKNEKIHLSCEIVILSHAHRCKMRAMPQSRFLTGCVHPREGFRSVTPLPVYYVSSVHRPPPPPPPLLPPASVLTADAHGRVQGA